jgi:hypothetical protein
MRKLSLFCLFAFALVAIALPASAQMAYVYAVHGIPGANGFPVDIAVDGACAVTGFTFGTVGGPLSLSAGPHIVQVYVANTMNPCSGSPALSANPSLEAGKSYALAAHLTAAGAPTLSGFELDLSNLGPGQGRFIVHHTAQAPCVDVTVTRGDNTRNAVNVPNFCNGAQIPAAFRPGDWNVTLSVGGNPVFGPTPVNLKPKTAQLIFAVGVFPSSFTYIVKTIPSM